MENVFAALKRVGLTAALVSVFAAALVGCGGEQAAPAATTQPAAQATNTTAPAASANTGSASSSDTTGSAGGASGAAEQDVKIVLTEWAIEPKTIEVKAGKVKFTVENKGQFTHNVALTIQGKGEISKTKNFKASESPQTLEVDLAPGTYEMVCDIPGHGAKGMVGTLVVK